MLKQFGVYAGILLCWVGLCSDSQLVFGLLGNMQRTSGLGSAHVPDSGPFVRG